MKMTIIPLPLLGTTPMVTRGKLSALLVEETLLKQALSHARDKLNKLSVAGMRLRSLQGGMHPTESKRLRILGFLGHERRVCEIAPRRVTR